MRLEFKYKKDGAEHYWLYSNEYLYGEYYTLFLKDGV